jgi:hypothetical protein
MKLSVRDESIILSAPPADSIILSVPPRGQWATPAAQWAAGQKSNRVGQQDGGGTMDSTMLSLDGSNFLYFRLVLFC